MKQTRLLMGMPITVEIMDSTASQNDLNSVFDYFTTVENRFSTYKDNSEIAKINRGELSAAHYSEDMKTILALSEQTKQETDGYFDIQHNGTCDPSGIVKGWSIQKAATLLKQQGFQNFYIDAGGDIQVAGKKNGNLWCVGIRNPFNHNEYVKVLALGDKGVATSGTAIREQHIYDPFQQNTPLTEISSLTVIGPNIYEADRFATAAFAMGRKGIHFIASLQGFEGYMIDTQVQATFTSGFERYVLHS
jgi:thiamine biosynthesis lipoprotein